MAQKRKKILFVDDDVNLLGILQQMMVKFSNNMWEVLTAPDVSRALGILQEHRATEHRFVQSRRLHPTIREVHAAVVLLLRA